MPNPDDDKEDSRIACERCHDKWDAKAEGLETNNTGLQDEISGLQDDLERVAKERDDWRERYAQLVEMTGTRIAQAVHARS